MAVWVKSEELGFGLQELGLGAQDLVCSNGVWERRKVSICSGVWVRERRWLIAVGSSLEAWVWDSG